MPWERCTGGEPARPATGISLILRPLGGNSGTDTELLSSIDADKQLAFKITTTVPRLAPGRYELVGGSLDTGVAARTIVRIR